MSSSVEMKIFFTLAVLAAVLVSTQAIHRSGRARTLAMKVPAHLPVRSIQLEESSGNGNGNGNSNNNGYLQSNGNMSFDDADREGNIVPQGLIDNLPSNIDAFWSNEQDGKAAEHHCESTKPVLSQQPRYVRCYKGQNPSSGSGKYPLDICANPLLQGKACAAKVKDGNQDKYLWGMCITIVLDESKFSQFSGMDSQQFLSSGSGDLWEHKTTSSSGVPPIVKGIKTPLQYKQGNHPFNPAKGLDTQSPNSKQTVFGVCALSQEASKIDSAAGKVKYNASQDKAKPTKSFYNAISNSDLKTVYMREIDILTDAVVISQLGDPLVR